MSVLRGIGSTWHYGVNPVTQVSLRASFSGNRAAQVADLAVPVIWRDPASGSRLMPQYLAASDAAKLGFASKFQVADTPTAPSPICAGATLEISVAYRFRGYGVVPR